MRTCFLKRGGTNLVVFFEGYGQDERPFAKMAEIMPKSSALLCCYDYAQKGDLPDLSSYEKTRLIAWSMGVALAPHYAKCLSNIVERIAVNGTVEGIDPKYGIDPGLWDKTAASLDERAAASFRLAMCGRGYRNYMKTGTSRSAGSMMAELLWIRNFLKEKPPSQGSFYDCAYVSGADLIFPPKAQRLSFNQRHVEIREVEGAHYQPELFARLIAERF